MAVRKVVCTIAFASIVFFAKGQSNSYADRLEKLGISPRGLSLGKTNANNYTQLLDIWSNPALLSSQKTKYASAYSHTDAFNGISKADVFSFGVNLDSSEISIGFGAYQISNGGIFDTRFLELQDGSYDFSQLNTFTNRDYGMKWFVSKSFSDKISLGSTLNLDFVSLGDFSHATAIGLDFGLTYAIDSSFKFSTNVYNPFGKYYLWNQNVSLLQSTYFQSNNYLQIRSTFVQLPGIQFGAEKLIPLNSWVGTKWMAKVGLGFSANSNTILQNKNMGLDAGFGCETSIKEKLFFRIGLSDFQHNQLNMSKINSQISLGVGLDLGAVQLDYALGNFVKTAIPANKNLLSLSYEFEKFRKNNPTTEPTRF